MTPLLLALVLLQNPAAEAFNRGLLNYNQHNPEEAARHLREAARLNPDDFNTRYLLGLVLTKTGQSEAGLREWQQALRINPRHAKLMLIMAVEYGKGRYFKEAAAISRQALDLTPDDPKAWFIALKAAQDARDPGAIDLAQKAAARFPDSARANFEYAFHLQRIGRTADALPYLKKATTLDPNYEEPYFYYGEILARDDKHEEAAAALRESLRIRPDYVAASVLLVKSLLALHQDAAAHRELQRIIALQPAHPQPHLLLSQLLYRQGDEDAAKREKDISLRLRRASPTLMEAPQPRPFPSP